MTPENFAYWLQGFFEVSGSEDLSPQQTQIVKDHLKLVFDKRTPERPAFPSDYFETEGKINTPKRYCYSPEREPPLYTYDPNEHHGSPASDFYADLDMGEILHTT